MNTLSGGIRPSDILEHPEATFQCTFAHLQTQLFEFDENILIYSYNTCGTIEKKLRDAKARGWRAANTMFRLGAVPARPEIYKFVDAQDRQLHMQTIRREHLVRSKMPTSQCDKCGSVCTHCMHCDTCQKRMNDVLDAAQQAAQVEMVEAEKRLATATAQQAAQVEMAEAEKRLADAETGLAEAGKENKKSKVRCMRCRKEYCDKPAYNRHLKSHHNCAMHPLFERTR